MEGKEKGESRERGRQKGKISKSGIVSSLSNAYIMLNDK
jgi:hypothetical protein